MHLEKPLPQSDKSNQKVVSYKTITNDENEQQCHSEWSEAE
jgi:hypothetical protein